MPEDKAINKVVYGGNTLMDITDTTATETDVISGKDFYLANGEKSSGTLINGNNLGYGFSDGSLPLAGIAKVGFTSVWDNDLPMMTIGSGRVGTDRVV